MDERHSNFASTETLMKNGGTAWQPVKDLPTGRDQLAGVGLDHGRFIVTGGLWYSWAILKATSINNPWQLCSILYYDIFILNLSLGGFDGEKVLDDILQYDSRTNNWSLLGKMSTARSAHAMSLVPANVKQYCTAQSGKWVAKHAIHVRFIVYGMK